MVDLSSEIVDLTQIDDDFATIWEELKTKGWRKHTFIPHSEDFVYMDPDGLKICRRNEIPNNIHFFTSKNDLIVWTGEERRKRGGENENDIVGTDSNYTNSNQDRDCAMQAKKQRVSAELPCAFTSSDCDLITSSTEYMHSNESAEDETRVQGDREVKEARFSIDFIDECRYNWGGSDCNEGLYSETNAILQDPPSTMSSSSSSSSSMENPCENCILPLAVISSASSSDGLKITDEFDTTHPSVNCKVNRNSPSSITVTSPSLQSFEHKNFCYSSHSSAPLCPSIDFPTSVLSIPHQDSDDSSDNNRIYCKLKIDALDKYAWCEGLVLEPLQGVEKPNGFKVFNVLFAGAGKEVTSIKLHPVSSRLKKFIFKKDFASCYQVLSETEYFMNIPIIKLPQSFQNCDAQESNNEMEESMCHLPLDGEVDKVGYDHNTNSVSYGSQQDEASFIALSEAVASTSLESDVHSNLTSTSLDETFSTSSPAISSTSPTTSISSNATFSSNALHKHEMFQELCELSFHKKPVEMQLCRSKENYPVVATHEFLKKRDPHSKIFVSFMSVNATVSGGTRLMKQEAADVGGLLRQWSADYFDAIKLHELQLKQLLNKKYAPSANTRSTTARASQRKKKTKQSSERYEEDENMDYACKSFPLFSCEEGGNCYLPTRLSINDESINLREEIESDGVVNSERINLRDLYCTFGKFMNQILRQSMVIPRSFASPFLLLFLCGGSDAIRNSSMSFEELLDAVCDVDPCYKNGFLEIMGISSPGTNDNTNIRSLSRTLSNVEFSMTAIYDEFIEPAILKHRLEALLAMQEGFNMACISKHILSYSRTEFEQYFVGDEVYSHEDVIPLLVFKTSKDDNDSVVATPITPMATAFREVVLESISLLNNAEVGQFIKFATGSCIIKKGMEIILKCEECDEATAYASYYPNWPLPRAITCFNTLRVPFIVNSKDIQKTQTESYLWTKENVLKNILHSLQSICADEEFMD